MKYKNALIVLSYVFVLIGVTTVKVNADCDKQYGSCKQDSKRESLDVTKRVAKDGSDDRSQKITGIKKGETFTFYINVKNKSNKKLDDVKLVDNLPSAFEKVSGNGATEYFALEVGEDKNFKIQAKIKDSEFENKSDFEKCSVNKAFVYEGNKEIDSSSATVCFGQGTAKSLPVTGAEELVLVGGILLSGLGLGMKRFLLN